MDLSGIILEVLQKQLKDLDSIENIVVASLSDNLFVFVPSQDERKLLNVSKLSSIIFKFWKLLRDVRWDRVRELYIRGTEKGILVVPFHNDQYFVAVEFHYPCNLSLINRTLLKTAKELDRIVVG